MFSSRRHLNQRGPSNVFLPTEGIQKVESTGNPAEDLLSISDPQMIFSPQKYFQSPFLHRKPVECFLAIENLRSSVFKRSQEGLLTIEDLLKDRFIGIPLFAELHTTQYFVYRRQVEGILLYMVSYLWSISRSSFCRRSQKIILS